MLISCFRGIDPSDVEVHSVSLASRIKQVGGLFQLLACTRTTANQPWHSPSLKRAGLDSSLQVVFLVARHGWASLHRSCSCVSFHAAASMMALLRKPAPDTRLTVPCCSWLTRPHPWISVRRGAAGLCPCVAMFVCCDAAIMHGLRPAFEALQKVYKICFVPDCDCCKKPVLQCRRFY